MTSAEDAFHALRGKYPGNRLVKTENDITICILTFGFISSFCCFVPTPSRKLDGTPTVVERWNSVVYPDGYMCCFVVDGKALWTGECQVMSNACKFRFVQLNNDLTIAMHTRWYYSPGFAYRGVVGLLNGDGWHNSYTGTGCMGLAFESIQAEVRAYFKRTPCYHVGLTGEVGLWLNDDPPKPTVVRVHQSAMHNRKRRRRDGGYFAYSRSEPYKRGTYKKHYKQPKCKRELPDMDEHDIYMTTVWLQMFLEPEDDVPVDDTCLSV
jgi:hypothetical protein